MIKSASIIVGEGSLNGKCLPAINKNATSPTTNRGLPLL